MFALLLSLLAATAAPETLALSLDQALKVAYKRSPAMGEVSADRTQSWVKPARGVAALLPTPSGSLSYSSAQTPSPLQPDSAITVKGWTGALTLAQVIFDPQVFAGVVSSFIYSGYSATDARDKQARLLYDVTSDYLGLLKARQLRDVAASALDRAGDNLNLDREKLRLGSASEIDVMRSEVFHSQAEIELLSAGTALAAANAAFLATAGITEDIVVRPTDELTVPSGFEITDDDSLLAAIQRANPSASLAGKASAVSSLNVVAAAAGALPSVSAYWSSNYEDTLFPKSVAAWQAHDTPSWGIRFGFPLLDIKSYILNIADASAEARRSRAGAARAKLQLRSTATAAILGYKEARQRYDYAQRNLELNRALYGLAEQQYRLGAISLIDFQSVETNLAQAQASYISALGDTYIQAAQIAYLLGSGPGK